MPSYTLAQLAEWVGGSLQGDPNLLITRVATLSQATSTKEGGDITFLSNPRYRRFLSETNAAAVILTEEDKALCPVASVIVKDPYLAYAKIATHFLPEALITPGIHPTASIAPSAEIHPTASIDAYVSVGANSRIGAHTRLHPHVVIGEDCVIGEECEIHPNTTFYNNVHLGAHGIIHSGCVIGADGFGFARHNKTWVKVPQLGRVYIGNDVEIGANTTIDRGALDDTVIEDGVKLDNQIQVGHGVRIGAHTAIAGCTGIAGSTHIGKYCMIGGASSINGHIQITDNVVVTAASAVTHAITEPGIYSSGMMLQENRKWRKNIIRFSQLDELARRIKQLEKEIQHFKGITETSYE